MLKIQCEAQDNRGEIIAMKKLNDISINGFILIANQEVYFRYVNNKITLYFPNNFELQSELEFYHLLGKEPETGKYICFRFWIPLIIPKREAFFFQNSIMHPVDYLVDNIKLDSNNDIKGLNRILFSFQELDYFLPSSTLVKGNANQPISIEKYREIKSFDFKYDDRNVKARFFICTNLNGYEKARLETIAYLEMSFDEMSFDAISNIDYIFKLFHIVFDFFSFIYNRQNLSLESVYLMPIISNVAVEKNPILYNVNIYKLPCESSERISHPCLFHIFSNNIKELFLLFVENKHIASSIHPSYLYRNMIDKKLYLSISSAFEYLTREDSGFTPKFVSDRSVEIDKILKDIILEHAEKKNEDGENLFTKNDKEKMNSIANRINSNELSLSEKILKIYNGYDKWEGLKVILSKWFPEEKIKALAQTANVWRNEHAHEKRKNTPTIDVLTGIRLLEHMNYSILLRKAGYSNENICVILDTILIR